MEAASVGGLFHLHLMPLEQANTFAPNPPDRIGASSEAVDWFHFTIQERHTHEGFAINRVSIECRFPILQCLPIL